MNSWNNWNEGTNLEPSDLKEERFLDVVKNQFLLQLESMESP